MKPSIGGIPSLKRGCLIYLFVHQLSGPRARSTRGSPAGMDLVLYVGVFSWHKMAKVLLRSPRSRRGVAEFQRVFAMDPQRPTGEDIPSLAPVPHISWRRGYHHVSRCFSSKRLSSEHLHTLHLLSTSMSVSSTYTSIFRRGVRGWPHPARIPLKYVVQAAARTRLFSVLTFAFAILHKKSVSVLLKSCS